jgi:hypothetical protein
MNAQSITFVGLALLVAIADPAAGASLRWSIRPAAGSFYQE